MNETQANQPAYLASTGINVSSPQKALPEHHTYHAIAHDIKMHAKTARKISRSYAQKKYNLIQTAMGVILAMSFLNINKSKMLRYRTDSRGKKSTRLRKRRENLVPYRIRSTTLYTLLPLVFLVFEKRRGPQLGPQTCFAENINVFESGHCSG